MIPLSKVIKFENPHIFTMNTKHLIFLVLVKNTRVLTSNKKWEQFDLFLKYKMCNSHFGRFAQYKHFLILLLNS